MQFQLDSQCIYHTGKMILHFINKQFKVSKKNKRKRNIGGWPPFYMLDCPIKPM